MLRFFTLIFLLFLIGCKLDRTESDFVTSPFVTHGPLLGRLGSTSVAVWARTLEPKSFRVRYTTSSNESGWVSRDVVTKLEHDNTGWLTLEGLAPDTRYYYTLECGNETYEGGSFRTLPDNKIYQNDTLNPAGLFNFSFEFACGNNQNEGHGSGTSLPTFKTLNERFVDEIYFSIQNGDWLYEYKREYSVEQWLEQTNTRKEEMPRILTYMPAMTGIWENYKSYLENGSHLARFHRYVPCFYTFDDHELLNDVIGTAEIGYVHRRTVIRDIAIRAWYDYLGWSNPIGFTQKIVFGKGELKAGSSVLIDPDATFMDIDGAQLTNLHIHWGTTDAAVNDLSLDTLPGDPNAGVYDLVAISNNQTLEIDPVAKMDGKASYSIGRRSYFKQCIGNCDFFYLDTRSTRHIHDHLNRRNPAKSMLGKEQMVWLLKGIAESEADFIFLVSSVNFMIPHLSGGENIVQFKDDAWTAFLHEREKLIQSCDDKPAPVFILTGDLHNSFAIKITDNVWEFASGPRNSNNHNYTDEGSRPATGTYTSFDRECEIRWSTWYLDDTPRSQLLHPHFCVVRINNVFNSPVEPDDTRYVAFERPQVIFQFYDGKNGDLVYAESITASR